MARKPAKSDKGETSRLRDAGGFQAQIFTLQDQVESLEEERSLLYNTCRGINRAMSGDMTLVLADGAAETITAAELNAAAAGTVKRQTAVRLEDSKKERHLWYYGTPLVTPAEAVADIEVGIPTVDGTPQFDHGTVGVTIIFDTDAGATKTYVPGDSVTVQIQINASDSLLGYTLAAGGVTKTFNVV